MGTGVSQDRRYQVFISSTYIDLQAERQEVIQALLELDCFPAGMELFPASNDERWDLIKSVIDDSDYYLVVIGGRYGSTDDEGISYTEKEYDYAVSAKKPVMGFLHSDPGEIPAKFTENDPDLQKKLDAFREKVGQRMCKMWKTPDELGSAVSRSLVKLMKAEPATGWVRADGALTPEVIEEMAALRQQVRELEEERERSRTTAPAGTEDLAQGDEETLLRYTYRFKPSTERWQTYEERDSARIPWNNVFAALGPAMFDEASESVLRSRLNDLALEWEREALLSQVHEDPDGEVSNVQVLQEDFDKVKIQLVALRLIEKSGKKHGVNDKATYWTLTPYGETYVMSLHAVRSGFEVEDDQGEDATAD